MSEKNERGWRSIDERLDYYQSHLKKCVEQLSNNPREEDLKRLEETKAENEHIIGLLNDEKERLLQSPKFLFLIANQYEYKLLWSVPTYIETQDEAKILTETSMRDYLEDNSIPLENGSYVGIIVRNAFYDKLSETEKLDVQSIFKNKNVHIISKEIIVSSGEISII